jgi:crossover junction endodeoxyribonuclease RuvC
VRTLGIDPAVRNTGYAILEGDHTSAKALDYGVISIPARIKQSGALEAICTGVRNLIEKWQPDEVAIEGIIYVQSHRTAISMGAARAAPLIAAAGFGLKKAIVGKGTADKNQVAFMIRALLGLSETPPPDAADALAIALAHLQASDPRRAALLDRREV